MSEGLTVTNIDGDVEGSPTLRIVCLTHTPAISLTCLIGSEGSPEFSDRNFAITASNLENLKIRPLEQTLTQEAGGLEVGLETILGVCMSIREDGLTLT